MHQLAAQDLRSVLNCLEALQELHTLQELPVHILRSIDSAIGSEISFCSSFTDHCNTLAATPVEGVSVVMEPDFALRL